MTFRFAVRSLIVPCAAMNRVRRVLRAVPGPVSIKVLAACPALQPVSASHAIGAALKPFPVGTNVQEFVVKHAMRTTATYALPKMKPE